MPKYKVETDQGAFMVELDKPPDSMDQLRSLVQGQIAGGSSMTPQQPQAQSSSGMPTPGELLTPQGFMKQMLNPFGTSEKGMEAYGRGIEAVGEFAGEPVRKMSEPLGPNISAALGTAANVGTQFALPGAVAKGGKLALKGAAYILPGSQAARTEIGIDKLKAATEKLRPSTSADSLYQSARSDVLGMKQDLRATNLLDSLDDLISAENKLSKGNQDATFLSVAKPLRDKIRQRGHISIEDLSNELSAIGENVNALKSQRQRVHSGFARLFGSAADDLERVPAGEALRDAAKTFRKEQAVDEILDMTDKVIMQKRGTGAQDINANRLVKQLREKKYVTESFEPGELKEIEEIAQKLIQMPALPAPKGASFGFGRTGGTALSVSGPAMLMGADPATATGLGATVAGLMDLSRILLPSPMGRKALRAVLESGPINQNKINMLMMVARGISGENLPPQSQP